MDQIFDEFKNKILKIKSIDSIENIKLLEIYDNLYYDFQEYGITDTYTDLPFNRVKTLVNDLNENNNPNIIIKSFEYNKIINQAYNRLYYWEDYELCVLKTKDEIVIIDCDNKIKLFQILCNKKEDIYEKIALLCDKYKIPIIQIEDKKTEQNLYPIFVNELKIYFNDKVINDKYYTEISKTNCMSELNTILNKIKIYNYLCLNLKSNIIDLNDNLLKNNYFFNQKSYIKFPLNKNTKNYKDLLNIINTNDLDIINTEEELVITKLLKDQ